jgi:hypothetical protein
MPSAAEQMKAIKAKAMDRTERAVRGGFVQVGERLIELSPVGDPALWQRLPSRDYHPGTFRSNWNASADQIDFSTTLSTNITEVNGLSALPPKLVGKVLYHANSLPYANALNWGHSSQAPVGILPIIEIEAPDISEDAARRAAQ